MDALFPLWKSDRAPTVVNLQILTFSYNLLLSRAFEFEEKNRVFILFPQTNHSFLVFHFFPAFSLKYLGEVVVNFYRWRSALQTITLPQFPKTR